MGSFYKYVQLSKYKGLDYRITSNLPGITASAIIPSSDKELVKKAGKIGRLIIELDGMSTFESKDSRFSSVLDDIISKWMEQSEDEFKQYLLNKENLDTLPWGNAQCACNPGRKLNIQQLRNIEKKNFEGQIRYGLLTGGGNLLFRIEVNNGSSIGKILAKRIETIAERNRMSFLSPIPSTMVEGAFKSSSNDAASISLDGASSVTVFQISGPIESALQEASYLVNVSFGLANMYAIADRFRKYLTGRNKMGPNMTNLSRFFPEGGIKSEDEFLKIAEKISGYNKETPRRTANRKTAKRKSTSSKRKPKHICKSAGRPPKKLTRGGRCRKARKK